MEQVTLLTFHAGMETLTPTMVKELAREAAVISGLTAGEYTLSLACHINTCARPLFSHT